MIFKFLKHMVSATVARDFAQQCKTEGHGVLRRARRDLNPRLAGFSDETASLLLPTH